MEPEPAAERVPAVGWQRPAPVPLVEATFMDVIKTVQASPANIRGTVMELLMNEPMTTLTNNILYFLRITPVVEHDNVDPIPVQDFIQRLEQLLVTHWRIILHAVASGPDDKLSLPTLDLILDLGAVQEGIMEV
jgi:hypothetical protein